MNTDHAQVTIHNISSTDPQVTSIKYFSTESLSDVYVVVYYWSPGDVYNISSTDPQVTSTIYLVLDRQVTWQCICILIPRWRQQYI